MVGSSSRCLLSFFAFKKRHSVFNRRPPLFLQPPKRTKSSKAAASREQSEEEEEEFVRPSPRPQYSQQRLGVKRKRAGEEIKDDDDEDEQVSVQ